MLLSELEHWLAHLGFNFRSMYLGYRYDPQSVQEATNQHVSIMFFFSLSFYSRPSLHLFLPSSFSKISGENILG